MESELERDISLCYDNGRRRSSSEESTARFFAHLAERPGLIDSLCNRFEDASASEQYAWQGPEYMG